MRRLIRTSQRTFLNVAFILSATWFYQTFSILLYPMSFTLGDGNLSMRYQWVVLSWSYRSLLQYAWFRYLCALICYVCHRGTRIVVTPDIIYEILQVPLVSHPDYPACPHLRTMSKDELLSLFCETPSSWGDRQNTSCSGFVKGPRFLNMVLTFVLHPLSHYNSITEPHARLLLSLIEDLSIDFPSHFILFLIDVYKDMATRDKFIFPSAITRSFAIILLLNPSLLTSPSWVPLARCLFCSIHLSSFFFHGWCNSRDHHGTA